MIRRLLILQMLILVCLTSQAQEEKTRYFNKDQLVIELLSNQWLDAPDDVKLHPRSLAFNLQLMYNLVGKNSNVALAAGLGLLTENYQIDALPKLSENKLSFAPLDDDLNYTSNKIRFTTVELPVEIRIRSNKNSRNKTWKLYLGGKAGYMFQSMHKYSGDDPVKPNQKLKQKTFNLPHTEQFTYGLTARLGYDAIMVTAYYGLTNHFKKDKAPALYPFMVGLTLFVY
ncbi:outer membrane beta-barrel protein [Salinivirga cyanobacteriivorans]